MKKARSKKKVTSGYVGENVSEITKVMEQIIEGKSTSKMEKEEALELAADINNSMYGLKKQLTSHTRERSKTELNKEYRAAPSRQAQ